MDYVAELWILSFPYKDHFPHECAHLLRQIRSLVYTITLVNGVKSKATLKFASVSLVLDVTANFIVIFNFPLLCRISHQQPPPPPHHESYSPARNSVLGSITPRELFSFMGITLLLRSLLL